MAGTIAGAARRGMKRLFDEFGVRLRIGTGRSCGKTDDKENDASHW